MISDINNIQQSSFQAPISQGQTLAKDTFEPMNSFVDEDQAIISSQAKLQYELEKFNAGADNLVDLMGTCVSSKFTVEAEVNVIQAKKDMVDDILDIGK